MPGRSNDTKTILCDEGTYSEQRHRHDTCSRCAVIWMRECNLRHNGRSRRDPPPWSRSAVPVVRTCPAAGTTEAATRRARSPPSTEASAACSSSPRLAPAIADIQAANCTAIRSLQHQRSYHPHCLQKLPLLRGIGSPVMCKRFGRGTFRWAGELRHSSVREIVWIAVASCLGSSGF